MSFFEYENIEIAGMSAAVPSQIVSVDKYAPIFGEKSVERFKQTTGVHQYHKALPDQAPSDLAFAAAEELFEKLGFNRKKIGLLTFVSLSQDYLRPATACVLQYRLNLSNDCTAFDVGMGCSGFTYGLQVAASMMQNSDIEWALLLCAETPTRLVYPTDKSTVMLVGDAGTAILLHKKLGHAMKALLGTDGSLFGAAIIPAGGFRNRDVSKRTFIDSEGIERTNYHYYMSGIDVFAYSMSDIPKAFKEYFKRTEEKIDDYDHLLLHQANKTIITQLAKKIKAPIEMVPISIGKFGNTSSAAIPLAMCDSFAGTKGKSRILSCGFGTGLSYGIASFSIDKSYILPIIETENVFKDNLIKE